MIPMNIVKRIDEHSDAEFQHINLALLEPVFLFGNTLLSLANIKSTEKFVDFMAQQTVRNPADLQHHLNRIDLYLQRENTEGLYGALMDLFIVLQDKGQPLRKRMLKKYYTQLDPEHRSILSARLAGKISEDDQIPFVKESMLSNGRTGMIRLLVKQSHVRDVKNRDAVEDARDLIDSGQVGKAQVLLKKVLLINPQREDVGQELMTIYRHSHNYQAVKKILQSTKNLPLALRPQWEDLAACLKTEIMKDGRQTSC